VVKWGYICFIKQLVIVSRARRAAPAARAAAGGGAGDYSYSYRGGVLSNTD